MGEYSGVLDKPANIAGVDYAVGDKVKLTEKQYKYLIATNSLKKDVKAETSAAVPEKK
jgi:hypothetical protein